VHHSLAALAGAFQHAAHYHGQPEGQQRVGEGGGGFVYE